MSSSEKTLEETLCQIVEGLNHKFPSTSCVVVGGATESVNANFSFGYPGREVSPRLHHKKGFECTDSKVGDEIMGPRQGTIGKHQNRRSSKGNIKVYPANTSNFKDLVYEHTSKPSSLHCVTQPASLLTPTSASSRQGFRSQPASPPTSTSSRRGFRSQPASPPTPHSIPSGPTSPLPPLPNQALPSDLYSNNSQQPNLCFNSNAHPKYLVHHNAHLDVSDFYPLLSSGVWTNGADVPSNGGRRPEGTSAPLSEGALSLEKFLMEDDVVYNAMCK